LIARPCSSETKKVTIQRRAAAIDGQRPSVNIFLDADALTGVVDVR
jgi:hypothetical protein